MYESLNRVFFLESHATASKVSKLLQTRYKDLKSELADYNELMQTDLTYTEVKEPTADIYHEVEEVLVHNIPYPLLRKCIDALCR